MVNEDLKTRLKFFAVKVLGFICDSSTNISEFLNRVEIACKMRDLVGPFQFEEMWQSHLPENQTAHIFIQFKFSPAALNHYNGYLGDFNQFSWAFVLPNIHDLKAEAVPADTVDYILLGSVHILSKNEETFTESGALQILDGYVTHSSR